MTTSDQRSAVVLDPHPVWLDGLCRVLDRMGIECRARTSNPRHALAAIEEYQPQLFVTEIDVSDSDIDGITCLRLAHEKAPGLKAVVLSHHQDTDHIDAAFAAGAAAYVIKTAHAEDLQAAIRQAFQHSVFFAAGPRPAPEPQPAPANDVPELTRRELEILQHVAEGYTNAQLARMLWVTEQTVKFHLSNIYRKLDVANRTEASRWAQKHGLLAPVGAGERAS